MSQSLNSCLACPHVSLRGNGSGRGMALTPLMGYCAEPVDPINACIPTCIDLACMSFKIAQLRESRTAPAAHGMGHPQEGPVACPPLDGQDGQVVVGRVNG